MPVLGTTGQSASTLSERLARLRTRRLSSLPVPRDTSVPALLQRPVRVPLPPARSLHYRPVLLSLLSQGHFAAGLALRSSPPASTDGLQYRAADDE